MDKQKDFCTMYLVRHGETEANVKKMIMGDTDSPLTSAGERQAHELAELFKNINFDEVFSSDLGRAKMTAEIIVSGRPLKISEFKNLREKSYGIYGGMLWNDFNIKNKLNLEKFKELPDQEKMKFKFDPSQESDEESAMRMADFLRQTGQKYFGKILLVVTHAAIMRAFLKYLGFAKFDELPGGAIENTGYVKLEIDGVDFFIRETKGVNKVTL